MDQDKAKEIEDFSRAVREFREARRKAEENTVNEKDRQDEDIYQEEKPGTILNVPWKEAVEREHDD